MTNNYLITGYHGEPHVTVENDRGINAGIVGSGRFVLPVGQQFRAEYIGNNTVRLYDGKLMNNGAAAGIPAGKYIDLLIPEAGQGMKRNDLIVFQYSQDSSTLIESGDFLVVQGTESSGTAADPKLTQEDLLTDEASFDQMPLWRVPVSGATISAPVRMFTMTPCLGNVNEVLDEALQEVDEALDNVGVVISKIATLGTNWVGDSAPYTQTVSVTGLLATDRPHISPAYSSTVATALAQREAWGMVCDVDSSTDKLTFTCFEDKPEVAIPIQIEVIR